STRTVWDVDTGKIALVPGGDFKDNRITGPNNEKRTASPSGNGWAEPWVDGFNDRCVRIVDTRNGKEVRLLATSNIMSPPASFIGTAYSHDEKTLAAARGDGTVWVWNLETGRALATLHGHQKLTVVSDVAFSPDGKRLVSVGRDRMVKIWETATWREIHTL